MRCSYIVLIILLCTGSGFAQDPQPEAELKKEIIGTWFKEDDPGSKAIFYDNGNVEYYYEGQIDHTATYQITDTCDGEKNRDGGFFLKETSKNGSYCSYIEGVNYNGSGFFSLMTKPRGKIIVYKRTKN